MEKETMGLPRYVYAEARRSGISLPLIRANFEYIDGDEAVAMLAERRAAELQKVTSYVTRPVADLLRRYEFASFGGWVAYGTTIDGGVGEVPYFKPKRPRKFRRPKGFGYTEKEIKYETPAGAVASPLLPNVDHYTASVIYRRFFVVPRPGESFWQVVRRSPGIPVAVTEGLKKALCLLSLGIPAIAIRGITQWHPKGEDTPYPVIAAFATEGREMPIIFDEDEKPKTRMAVETQTKRLGHALEALDKTVKVTVPTWDGGLGKGIDDRVVALSEDRVSWIHALLREAPSLKGYITLCRVALAQRSILRLNTLDLVPTRTSSGGYMPVLPPPEPGVIEAITAPMGTGKTTRIRGDRIALAKERGWFTLILPPLNSLGRQVAKDTGLPHIHDFGTRDFEQRALWATAFEAGGIVMCPDSLHRIPERVFERPLLLILDEANQTISHTVGGDTLGARHAETLERLAALSTHALRTGSIILAEAVLPPRAIHFIQAIADAEGSVRLYEHRGTELPWNGTLYRRDISGFRARLLGALGEGKRILFVTASRAEGERLEYAVRSIGIERVVRIDGDTNEAGAFDNFFEVPDDWLKDNSPDLLILSPSAKSGVSIEGGTSTKDAFFDEVWGHFTTLATDTHLQLLGRYRPPVPRHIFCSPFILADGDESLFSPRRIKKRLRSNMAGLAKLHGLESLLCDDARSESHLKIEAAALDYLAAAKAVSGSQKSIAADALAYALTESGHSITEAELPRDQEVKALWHDVQEAIWQKRSHEFAELDVSELTERWATDVLKKVDASRIDRLKATKILRQQEFPGITFDSPDEVYQALIGDYGKMRRGVVLQAAIEDLDASFAAEKGSVNAILSSSIRCPHRFPRTYMKALLLKEVGILHLLDLPEWTGSHRVLAAIKEKALYWRREISYWLRLEVKPTQSPCEIAHKLLKKLGLKATAEKRTGPRNSNRERTYCLEDPGEVRERLLSAAKERLLVVSKVCRNSSSSLQTLDTSLLPVNEGLADWWQIATSALASGNEEAIAAVRELLQGSASEATRQKLIHYFSVDETKALGLREAA